MNLDDYISQYNKSKKISHRRNSTNIPIEKSLKEAKSMLLIHIYMTTHLPGLVHI